MKEESCSLISLAQIRSSNEAQNTMRKKQQMPPRTEVKKEDQAPCRLQNNCRGRLGVSGDTPGRSWLSARIGSSLGPGDPYISVSMETNGGGAYSWRAACVMLCSEVTWPLAVSVHGCCWILGGGGGGGGGVPGSQDPCI